MSNTIERADSEPSPGRELSAALVRRFAAGGDLSVVGLGDSLTYGWMVDRGFFDRFVDRLETAYPRASIARINAGVPGDTADGGLGRVDALLARRPTLVLIQFGLNDMAQGVVPSEYGVSLTAMVRRVRNAGAIPAVVTSSPVPWPEGARACETFYGICREVAAAEDVPAASLDRDWKGLRASPAQWGDLLQSDEVHPTDAGHALMAVGLLSALFAE